MMLKKLELAGFKSFAKTYEFVFDQPVTAIVGPNGSGKSNVVEAIRFVLGEQSTKSLRSKSGSDLIFKGSHHVSKMNRAKVSITFDNNKRLFHLSSTNDTKVSLDFDEITITREIFADGTSKYAINGSDVRMRDIHELVASVNIGTTGHHVISQGEADRLLNTGAKERREIIEESLGLKLYQYRIRESERKLERTKSNLDQIESARRELAPHIRFLKKQVEKIERAEGLRDELFQKESEYLKREELLIQDEEAKYKGEYTELTNEVAAIDDELASIKVLFEKATQTDTHETQALERSIQDVRDKREEASRELGRIEGMIEVSERAILRAKEEQSSVLDIRVRLRDIEEAFGGAIANIDAVLAGSDDRELRATLKRLRDSYVSFVDEQRRRVSQGETLDTNRMRAELDDLKKHRGGLQSDIKNYTTREQEIATEITKLRDVHASDRKELGDLESRLMELSRKRAEYGAKLGVISERIQGLGQFRQQLKEELREAIVLIGDDIHGYTEHSIDETITLDRETQESMRRDVERLKIKLEELGGGGGSEVIAEYEEAAARDEHLKGQVEDLKTSIVSIEDAITDLKKKLEKEFTSGIKKINSEFDAFFKRMFGGGSGTLKMIPIESRKRRITDEIGEVVEIEDEEESSDQGIEIKVSLPRKKVGDLDMLSGGERSLTSIALLFALSQVNPPPFLVLDETDAALDEANSQKYGNMLEDLSKVSQLVVVTHNRETMSRADILYGVTMSHEDVSQLLSVKLTEAEQYAK